jgi:integrase
MLATYRRELMPKLGPGGSDALFCRTDGTPLGADNIANRIGDTPWREVGLRMSMHQFRHLAAALILDDNPGGYELARDHLGHSSSTITTRYYSGQTPDLFWLSIESVSSRAAIIQAYSIRPVHP